MSYDTEWGRAVSEWHGDDVPGEYEDDGPTHNGLRADVVDPGPPSIPCAGTVYRQSSLVGVPRTTITRLSRGITAWPRLDPCGHRTMHESGFCPAHRPKETDDEADR